jgi:hypothetical protein
MKRSAVFTPIGEERLEKSAEADSSAHPCSSVPGETQEAGPTRSPVSGAERTISVHPGWGRLVCYLEPYLGMSNITWLEEGEW